MIPVSEIYRHCPDITKEAAAGLHHLAESLGVAAFEVGKTLIVMREEARSVISSRTLSSLTSDLNDGLYLPRAGFQRAEKHNGELLKGGKKLFEFPGCDARFKVVSNGRADRLQLATNAGRHLKGAYLLAYHRVLDFKKACAGIDGLWLLKVSKVSDRKASKRGAFAGNVGNLDFSEEFRLAVPAGAKVQRLTA